MAHPPTTRYVILAWNRGEGVPRVYGANLYDNVEVANDFADDARAAAFPHQVTYTVHEVDMREVDA